MTNIKLQSQAKVPTEYGEFNILAFAQSNKEPMPHIAIVSPKINVTQPVLLRIHSECMTGDVFHSQKCDCGDQLDFSMKQIGEKSGIVIYLRQEGRGIGLIEKLKAYKLQDEGFDTVDANLELGHQADQRDYSDAVEILKNLNINAVRLMTNNPDKLEFLKSHGIDVKERVSIVLPAHQHSAEYIRIKKEKMGHLI